MTLIDALDIQNIRLTEKGYVARMLLGEFHEQLFGFVNGGAVLAFAEITAGQASNLLGEEKYYAVGQTITGNHLKKKKAEGYLCAAGELLHKGKRSHVWNIRILDEHGMLISQVTVVNALVMKED